MAKKDFSEFIKFGVAKTSFNSSKQTWEQAKAWEYAYMITNGLSAGTFFAQSAPKGTYFETIVGAQEASYKIREYNRDELANRRYGYSSYKNRIWVHEFLTKDGRNGAYLPTIGEVKKGIEYIKENLLSENFRSEWVDWAGAHDGMTPTQIRNELIENFLKN